MDEEIRSNANKEGVEIKRRVARLGIFVARFTNLGTFDLVGNKIFWVGNLGSNWEYFGPVGNSEKSWEFWELSGNF